MSFTTSSMQILESLIITINIIMPLMEPWLLSVVATFMYVQSDSNINSDNEFSGLVNGASSFTLAWFPQTCIYYIRASLDIP